MQQHGFKVERHYGGLSTAWRATYSYGVGGRVMGINSEMDALPGIGHACGHNLIAAAGVGVAVAAKAALEYHKIPGKIVIHVTTDIRQPPDVLCNPEDERIECTKKSLGTCVAECVASIHVKSTIDFDNLQRLPVYSHG